MEAIEFLQNLVNVIGFDKREGVVDISSVEFNQSRCRSFYPSPPMVSHSWHPLQATGGGNEIWKKYSLVGEMKLLIIRRGSPYLEGMDFPGGGFDDSIDNFLLLNIFIWRS